MDRPYTVEAKFNKIQTPPPTTPSLPNVAKTPSPGGPIPIPFPNIGAAPLGTELTAISTMIVDGKPESTVLEAWKGYVTRQVQAKRPLKMQDTILQVQRQAEMQVKARTDMEKARLSNTVDSIGEMGQQANLRMQQIMQRQQEAMQAISNMMKKLHDTAMAIISNLK